LQEIFVILYTGMAYNLLVVWKLQIKHFASRDVQYIIVHTFSEI
jgi:hypothetical protein